MQKIVECVPNFSDGQRPEVYNAIADAIGGVPGTLVLDVSADVDHNRSVITFVGTPAAVEEAAYQAIDTASRLINLDEHKGEHPRIGATDVCPFIPVKGVTTDECVELANRVAQRIGEELGIAVYMYGAAAKRPEREKLSNVRRGQYELWRDEVATNPDRRPDYGPAEAKPWGATVIGVRPFLIAYNIYLNTDDVSLADKIARAVRFSSGGLRYVQAMGFLVDGLAQVSMNLTDFTKTPIYLVQEMVRREAARYGLAITKSELVGLIPEKALLESARWYLQADNLGDDQILELRMAKEEAADFTPRALFDATAAPTPAPGGGSSAAVAGALAAALTHMVASLTVGRKKYSDVEVRMMEIVESAKSLGDQLASAVQEDTFAFNQLIAAWRIKNSADEARESAVEAATIYAGEVPLKVARLSREVAGLARSTVEFGNSNAVTDAAAAGVLARAAVQVAALNVKINALGLDRPQLTKAWIREIESLDEETSALADECVGIAAQRGGF